MTSQVMALEQGLPLHIIHLEPPEGAVAEGVVTMQTRTLDMVILACLLLMGASLLHSSGSPTPGAAAKKASGRGAAFPPAPDTTQFVRPRQLPAQVPPLEGDPDSAISRIAQWASVDADPMRRSFVYSQDLYGFVQKRLPDARAGDGASQYYIYLALDECRTYLRLRPDEARALEERMQLSLDDGYSQERQSWLHDNQRCYRFAGGNLSAIADALGADRPGAEVEYGSVWFERSADSGFPPALAERALREPGYDLAARRDMLSQALLSGNADVYWQLFRRRWSGDADSAESALSLAWLIEACRKGYDCGSQVPWYRLGDCADSGGSCLPGQTALAHYWYAASTHGRELAFAHAQQIEAATRAGQWDELPWPEIRGRDLAAPTSDYVGGPLADEALPEPEGQTEPTASSE